MTHQDANKILGRLFHDRSVTEYNTSPAICAQCRDVIQLNGARPNERRKQRFCSSSCAATYNNHAYPKRHKQTKKCIKCDRDVVSAFAKYCAVHTTKRSRRYSTLQDIIDGYRGSGYAPGIAYSHVRSRARRMLLKTARTRCEIASCGYATHIEAAHIKPISSFRLDTLIETINKPENILALCPNHHWELDNNVLDINSQRDSNSCV